MPYFNLKTSVSLAIIFTILLTNSCQKSRNEQIEFVRNSVVSFELRWNTDKKKLSSGHFGTGFFVSENLIATAFHVSKQLEKERAKVSTEFVEIIVEKHSELGEESFSTPVKLEITDEENDLAIFSFEPLEIKNQWETFVIKPLLLAEILPQISDEVSVTGYYDQFSNPLSSFGTVSMITENNLHIKNDKNYSYNQAIFSDVTTMPGHSGGPLVLVRTGKVVGVCTRIITPTENDYIRTSIATNFIHLKTLIELDLMRNKTAVTATS